jgi:hypothetical protein
VEKFEAFDMAAGIYHARQLPRMRYNGQDFLEYLSSMEWEENEPLPGDCDTA